MHGARKHTVILAGWLFFALLLVACTTATRRKLANIFLDGVPPERSPAPSGLATSPALPPPEAAKALGQPPPGQLSGQGGAVLIVHKPYADRQCGACHESAFSQKLVAEVTELCQLCHKSLFAEAKFRHAPAEAGTCLECHSPHQSTEKALLVLPGRQLCLECHEEKDLARTVEHGHIGQSACHTCHNPHGGDSRFFLKSGWQTTLPPVPAGFHQ